MATNYPGSLDSGTQQPSPSASTEMDDSGFEHDVVHTNHSGAIIALETKVGTGDSNAVANSVLAGTGSGTSGWTTGTLANAISGNAATATALATARAINGVNFDGSAAITVTAAAGTLTGATLASGVTASSLTSVGTLTALTMGATSTSEGGEIRFDGGTSYAANFARIDRYGNNLLRFMDQSAVRMSLDITNGNLVVTGDATTTTTRATTAFYVGASGDDGIGPVTGSYGSVQTRGTGAGSYEGYSINGQQVFMGNGAEICGIYNDVDNQWLLYFDADTYTRLYDSDGIVAFGANNYTSGGSGSAGNGYVGVSNYCGGFSGTAAVMASTTIAGVAMKRLGFSSSSYEFKSGIEDLVMSDEAFMSLKPITYHPNDQYVDITGDVTEIPGGHTIIPDKIEAGDTPALLPLKRAGFGLEDLYGREDTMILATEFAPDSNALIALLTLKLQETMTRVAALETV